MKTVFNFRGFITLVIILLLTQQSFAALMPMKCKDVKEHHTTQLKSKSQHNSHQSSDMQMTDHNMSLKIKMTSHEKCDACNSIDCQCGEFGRCTSSPIAISALAIDYGYTLLLDHGKRFIMSDEDPYSGINLHPFRPPIHS